MRGAHHTWSVLFEQAPQVIELVLGVFEFLLNCVVRPFSNRKLNDAVSTKSGNQVARCTLLNNLSLVYDGDTIAKATALPDVSAITR